VSFANMKSFIVQQGFQFVSDKENYDPKDYNSKWGAHDGKVLDSQLDYLQKTKQPFFSGLLTLSTHEPFEVPIKPKFSHDTDPNKFKNSAYYTDQCLKNYFTKAKRSSWYKNTIFLLVADHGHRLPRVRNMNFPDSKRIVCLITGGALTQKMRGKKWEHVVNQHDMIRLLSSYFGYDEKKFPFAKHPFRSIHPFAYYSNENVLGFVTDSCSLVYELTTGKTSGDKHLMEYAKAYLQWTYKDFVDR